MYMFLFEDFAFEYCIMSCHNVPTRHYMLTDALYHYMVRAVRENGYKYLWKCINAQITIRYMNSALIYEMQGIRASVTSG